FRAAVAAQRGQRVEARRSGRRMRTARRTHFPPRPLPRTSRLVVCGARGNPPIRTHPSILRATPCTSAPTSARPRSHSRTDAHARYIAAMLRETRHERLLKLLREEGVLPVG